MESESMPRTKGFEPLVQRLGYTFRHPELLEEAFRHASFVNEQGEAGLRDNERLEFLGDAVLDLAISHILMDFFQGAKEGDLSKYRASVVNERGLSQVAMALNLGNHLLLGRGEELGGGRSKPSILADTLEALLGALYLDAGYDRTMQIIQELFHPLLLKLDSGEAMDDYKSLLQEYTQEIFKTRPDYVLIQESGPSHDKIFRVAVHLRGRFLAEAEGGNKKDAEQKAAREAFHCLTSDPDVP